MTSSPNDMPRYGIGLRRPHFDAILEETPGVDFVEVLPENFMAFGGRPQKVLAKVRDRLPVVLHGVSMSIGGPDPLDDDYLDKLEALISWLEPPWFSDHLSYSRAFGVEYHDLLPLPFSEAAIEHVVRRVDAVQERFRIPFLLENPSYYVVLPGAEMSEAEFIAQVVRRSGCGLLLDVNNVYVNSQNHGYDPYRFIDALPLEQVRQLHIAGHDDTGPFIVDSHGAPIRDEVFELYRYVLERLGPSWTLLEWDNDIPSYARLLEENDAVRRAGDSVLEQAA